MIWTIVFWAIICLSITSGMYALFTKLGMTGKASEKANIEIGVAGVTVAPVFEEAMHRYPVLLLSSFSMAASWASVVLLSGLLFGFLHIVGIDSIEWKERPNSKFVVYRFISTSIIGLILGYVVIVTQSLLMTIGIHFVMNAIIISL